MFAKLDICQDGAIRFDTRAFSFVSHLIQNIEVLIQNRHYAHSSTSWASQHLTHLNQSSRGIVTARMEVFALNPAQPCGPIRHAEAVAQPHASKAQCEKKTPTLSIPGR